MSKSKGFRHSFFDLFSLTCSKSSVHSHSLHQRWPYQSSLTPFSQFEPIYLYDSLVIFNSFSFSFLAGQTGFLFSYLFLAFGGACLDRSFKSFIRHSRSRHLGWSSSPFTNNNSGCGAHFSYRPLQLLSSRGCTRCILFPHPPLTNCPTIDIFLRTSRPSVSSYAPPSPHYL